MRHLFALMLAAALFSTTLAVDAQTTASSAAVAQQECDIGYVTGVGGSPESLEEYLESPSRDKMRFMTDHPIDCKISDEGRATACTGVTYLKNERASVYDDTDSVTSMVSTHVELDRGTYTVIIAVPKQAMHCQP